VLNNNFQKCAGTLKTPDVAARLNREVDHVIPYQKRLITALNRGEPYVLSAGKRFGWGKALNRIVKELQDLSKASAVMHSLDSTERSARKAIMRESASA
jgi:septum formation inhibitor-activating ATPase MinD